LHVHSGTVTVTPVSRLTTCAMVCYLLAHFTLCQRVGGAENARLVNDGTNSRAVKPKDRLFSRSRFYSSPVIWTSIFPRSPAFSVVQTSGRKPLESVTTAPSYAAVTTTIRLFIHTH